MWNTEDMVLGKQGPTPPMPSSTVDFFAFIRPWEGGVVFSLPFLPSFIRKASPEAAGWLLRRLPIDTVSRITYFLCVRLALTLTLAG